MIPSELNRMSRSAAATGPFGSRTPSEQPPSIAALIKTTASTAYRISDLVCAETGEAARGPDRSHHGIRLHHRSDLSRSSTSGQHGWPSTTAIAGQQRREQRQ